MEEGDVASCQRKSRSPLQRPAIDENGHSGGQKHEEDFYREESHRKRPKGTTNTLSCPQSFAESILYCVEAYSAVLIKLLL